MAKLKSKITFDGVYNHLIDKDVINKSDVSEMQIIVPQFKSSKIEDYERTALYPSVPFRMIIVGSSGSGKSELIKKIFKKDPEFYCERDFMQWYGKNEEYPFNKMQFPHYSPSGDQHGIVAYDDPKPEYYPLISDVFRLGRPRGISPIVAIHSWDQLIQSPKLRILKDQANIIVLCQEAATEVFERHQASFNGFLRCPNKMRKIELLNSMDGRFDYNWILNGKECKNYKIGYPKTIGTFKKETINPMYKVIEDSSTSSSSSSDSSSSDSDDSDSSISDDGDDVQLRMRKRTFPKSKDDTDEYKDKYSNLIKNYHPRKKCRL